ncbi:hypothetical protein D3C76_1348770 [compost metagenome]
MKQSGHTGSLLAGSFWRDRVYAEDLRKLFQCIERRCADRVDVDTTAASVQCSNTDVSALGQQVKQALVDALDDLFVEVVFFAHADDVL